MKKSKKISVSMIGSFPPLKAISSYCLELVNELDKRVNLLFFSFLSIYPSFMHPTKEEIYDDSFPDIQLQSTKVKKSLTWYNPLSWIKASIENKPNIFHIQWWSLPTAPIIIWMALITKIKKIPIVITVHNVSSHEKSFLFTFASKTLFALSDVFIVHSLKNKMVLIHYSKIDSDKISIIPHGPLNFFKYTDFNENKERDYFRKKFNICDHEKVILFFGAIRPYKNLDLILKALALVIKQVEVRLVIAGSLWENWSRYKKIIMKNNLSKYVIKALHYIPSEDVSMYFAASDLALITYKDFNSQSGVGAAALSFNKPMIVSDSGGLPKLVKDSYCILKKKNHKILAEKIVTILSDKQFYNKLMCDSAEIKESISWKKIGDDTLKVYKKLLDIRN